MLVEDDAYLREGLLDLLSREGYLPDAAADLAEAREKLKQASYRLTILDVMLPDGTGVM